MYSQSLKVKTKKCESRYGMRKEGISSQLEVIYKDEDEKSLSDIINIELVPMKAAKRIIKRK